MSDLTLTSPLSYFYELDSHRGPLTQDQSAKFQGTLIIKRRAPAYI